MWKNNVEWGSPQMTIWRIALHAGYLRKKITQSGCVILTAFPLQQWLHESASMLLLRALTLLLNYRTVVNKAYQHGAGRPSTVWGKINTYDFRGLALFLPSRNWYYVHRSDIVIFFILRSAKVVANKPGAFWIPGGCKRTRDILNAKMSHTNKGHYEYTPVSQEPGTFGFCTVPDKTRDSLNTRRLLTNQGHFECCDVSDEPGILWIQASCTRNRGMWIVRSSRQTRDILNRMRFQTNQEYSEKLAAILPVGSPGWIYVPIEVINITEIFTLSTKNPKTWVRTTETSSISNILQTWTMFNTISVYWINQ